MPVMSKAKRNLLPSLLRALVFWPPIAFALYFGILALGKTLAWLEVPAAITSWACSICAALIIYGLIAIFIILAVISLAGTFVAIAAVTSWLERYGLLEDAITYVLLVALVPLSLGIAYFLYQVPAGGWRSLVRSFLCSSC